MHVEYAVDRDEIVDVICNTYFIMMSDTNLEDLLEFDFSNKEFYSTESCSSAISESEHDNEPPKEVDHRIATETAVKSLDMLARISPRSPFVYVCPVCNKELRSVSGFRGHVMKQHPDFSRIGFKGRYALITSI